MIRISQRPKKQYYYVTYKVDKGTGSCTISSNAGHFPFEFARDFIMKENRVSGVVILDYKKMSPLEAKEYSKTCKRKEATA